MQLFIMMMTFGMIVWCISMVVIECEVTEYAVLVVVFWASFMCHYVAFYNYMYRGHKMGRKYKRWPILREILNIAVNMWVTIASFLEFWRLVFGWHLVFMAQWMALLCVAYQLLVIVFHFFWSQLISILMCHTLYDLPITSSPQTTVTITTDAMHAAANTPPSE
ncbi:uncharacterized protein LOC131012287 [Salvia miltiorrhiza]|uniref:uncharacterized protein LOC131012287 n=1 Tax=Salvia miltiorrhiza TaxID=226208 RepID=UPI0025ABDA01|nr:uncharacterized protein LOC131012287 [Salvia miltiorrhiza]